MYKDKLLKKTEFMDKMKNGLFDDRRTRLKKKFMELKKKYEQ